MLTGELRSQVDRLWDSFWTGGISNPLKVVEQITYLLFLKRLDDLQTFEENKSERLGKPIESEIFPAGKDARGCSYADMRWSRLKNQSPDRMFTLVSDHIDRRLSARNLRAVGRNDCSVRYDIGATLVDFGLILRNFLTILEGFRDMFFKFGGIFSCS